MAQKKRKESEWNEARIAAGVPETVQNAELKFRLINPLTALQTWQSRALIRGCRSAVRSDFSAYFS